MNVSTAATIALARIELIICAIACIAVAAHFWRTAPPLDAGFPAERRADHATALCYAGIGVAFAFIGWGLQ